MEITVNEVLRVYEAVLDHTMSYSDADRWSYNMMEEFDKTSLTFKPIADEKLIWELIQYLYGIDVPLMTDMSKTARTDEDIIDFLQQHHIYGLISSK